MLQQPGENLNLPILTPKPDIILINAGLDDIAVEGTLLAKNKDPPRTYLKALEEDLPKLAHLINSITVTVLKNIFLITLSYIFDFKAA